MEWNNVLILSVMPRPKLFTGPQSLLPLENKFIILDNITLVAEITNNKVFFFFSENGILLSLNPDRTICE